MKYFNFFQDWFQTLELNESRFHSWNCFFEMSQKWTDENITCASSCNHKSTCFVIFVFIHLLCFLLKGNSSYFEISYFWKIFISYISVEIVWEIISMCMLNNARLIVLIRGNIDPKAFCCKRSDSDLFDFCWWWLM